MKKTVGIIVGVLVLIGVAYVIAGSVDSEMSSDATQTLSISTSFYPLEFALERIVGEFGTVTNIGAGRDPHNFEPSTQDMVTLQRSDLVVLQGSNFEPWGDDVIARLEADNVPVVLATANIKLHEGGHDHEGEDSHDEDHNASEEDPHLDDHDSDSHDDEYKEDSHKDEHDHGSYDPHTWLDPVLFGFMVEHLTEEIAALDPVNAATYRSNAAALQSELTALDVEYTDRLFNCDLDEVITSHDAFGYVGDRYDFKVHSIAGLSTQDTPSVTTLAELRAEAAEGIGAILLEENSITAYGETLARETGLQTLNLNPIAFSIPANETYVTLMQKNLDSFVIALACNE